MSREGREDVRWHRLFERLDKLENTITLVLGMEILNMNEMEDLTKAVGDQKTVDDSIEALLDQLAAQSDPVKLRALVTDLQANTAKVQAAIIKNTAVTPAVAATPAA